MQCRLHHTIASKKVSAVYRDAANSPQLCWFSSMLPLQERETESERHRPAWSASLASCMQPFDRAPGVSSALGLDSAAGSFPPCCMALAFCANSSGFENMLSLVLASTAASTRNSDLKELGVSCRSRKTFSCLARIATYRAWLVMRDRRNQPSSDNVEKINTGRGGRRKIIYTAEPLCFFSCSHRRLRFLESMLPLAKTAAAAACVLYAATGFFVPSLGPRSAVSGPRNHSVQQSRPSLRSKPMMADTPVVKRVAIVGAGVGGLTLANALSTGSMAVEEVKVFEKFDSVKSGIGGGVQINSGAVILAQLGLGDAIKVGRFCSAIVRVYRTLIP